MIFKVNCTKKALKNFEESLNKYENFLDMKRLTFNPFVA